MGKYKKVDYRAKQAHQRNKQQAEYARKAAARKAYWDANGRQITIIAVIAIAVILVAWLGGKWFIGPKGSLPNFFGYVRGIEDNWIVKNTGTNSDPLYYHLADYTAPEGFHPEDFTVSTDEIEQTLYFVADDENSLVQSIYLSGVKNKTAAEQVESVLNYSTSYVEATEALSGNVSGHDVSYCYVIYNNTNDDGTPSEDGYGSLVMYADTPYDACVLVMFNTRDALIDEVPSFEEVFPEAEKIIAGLTLCD